MSQTHLYFIETRSNEQRHLLCHLVDFLYENGKRIQILADSTMAAQHLDGLLWTFSQESFIPHRVLPSNVTGAVPEPVVITVGEKVREGYPVLVCDGTTRPEFIKWFPCAIHFVLMDDPDRRQGSRLLWQTTRDQGFQVHHVAYSPPAKISSFLEKLKVCD